MRILSKAKKDSICTYIQEKEALFSPLAVRNSAGIRRRRRQPDDIRTRFSRDTDRIIHSRAYSRYIDKTQVFYLVDNDHITHRVLHVQLVSKIARTIGRSLRLNEDLIEAIALGHDIGHIPYGHTGESCLSRICRKEGIGPFRHNIQSIRFLDVIEDCNLTLQVLDGILCHDGERHDTTLRPDLCEDWAAFEDKICQIEKGGMNIPPMTLEGCVVRFADTIAYIGRDIQDARELGLIGEDTEPPGEVSEVLGPTNREIVDTLILDLIEHSDCTNEGCIGYSPETGAALGNLREFNYHHIYENPVLTQDHQKIRRMYEILFYQFLDDLENGNRESRVIQDFVDSRWVNQEYVAHALPQEIIRDFIAGMTDRYFENRYRESILPRRIEGQLTLKKIL